MAGPLEGVKVLDMAQALAGPVAATHLAEMGADVIKVEPPWGDFVRSFPPYKNAVDLGLSAYSRSKRYVALDVGKEKDKAIILEMVKWADVFVENYRTGTADKIGLGYEALSKINPRLIYCSVAGYGHKGPLRRRGSVEMVGQCLAGLGSINGPVGGPGEYVHMVTTDIYTPAYTCQSILMALFARETTGRGQLIESSQFEVGIAVQQSRAAEYFATGINPAPLGSGSLNIVPSQAFATRDSHVIVEVPNERIWRRFCKALHIDELADSPAFATNASRVEHRGELVPLLEDNFRRKTSSEWMAILRKNEVPCALVANTLDDIAADPQVKANSLIFQMVDPKAGPINVVQVPWKFSETPGRVKNLVTTLGVDQKKVLKEFGFDAEDIPLDEALHATKAKEERSGGHH